MVRVAWVLAVLDGAEAPTAGVAVEFKGSKPVDEMLTVAQVGALLGLSEKSVYNRAAEWPFTNKFGPKTLRFSRLGLERWLAGREI